LTHLMQAAITRACVEEESGVLGVLGHSGSPSRH
jgi:hypothetical protein